MTWSWKLESAHGEPVETTVEPPSFSSQSDAESWLGEVWRELVDDGAAQASLFDDERLVYGPMSLSAD